MTDIPFNGGIAKLHLGAPTGDRIRAQGNFYTDHTFIELDWLPEEKLAMEVELRMNIISCNAPGVAAPVIRYRIEYGHGDSTITLPNQILMNNAAFDIASANSGFFLPARGRVMRLSARLVRVKVFIAGLLHGAAWPTPQALIQCSINPCSGMQIPISANEDSLLPFAGAPPNAPERLAVFPSEANEFRVRQEDGEAWPAATANIAFIGLNGYTVVKDAALYADWTPIPIFAQVWLSAAPVGNTMLVQYRQ